MELLGCCQSPKKWDGRIVDFTLDLKASAYKLQDTSVHVSLDKGSHMAPFKLKELGKFNVLSLSKEKTRNIG